MQGLVPVNIECAPPIETISQRSEVDRPDDNKDFQIHVFYVIPQDGIDRHLDTDGTISNSVSAWQNWLCSQTPGRTMRLDTYEGKLDITFVRLSDTEAAISSAEPPAIPIAEGLAKKGYTKPQLCHF